MDESMNDISSKLEIRITFLEDQLNRMNIQMADQDRRIGELTDAVNLLATRFKAFEYESGSPGDNRFTPSEMPPDSVNR